MAVEVEDYTQLFRTLAIRSILRALSLVTTAEGVPTQETRNFALHSLTYGLDLPTAWDMVRALLVALVPHLARLGYRDDWIGYLEKGVSQAQHVGDLEGSALLSFHLGILYQYQTRYAAALEHFTQSVTYFENAGDPYHQGKVLNRVAYVARRRGEHTEALSLAEAAEALVGTDAAERAYSSLVRGTVAFDQRRWQDAHLYFVQSLSWWAATEDQWLKAKGFTNLGTTLWALQRYPEAITQYEQAVTLFEQIGDPVNRAVAWLNWGNALLHLEQFEDALQLYLRADRTFRSLHDLVRLAALHNNIGMVSQKLQRFDAAAEAYRFSIQCWTDVGNTASLVNVMDNLGLLYDEQGKVDEARQVFSQAIALLETIRHSSMYRHLSTIVTQHLDALPAHA